MAILWDKPLRTRLDRISAIVVEELRPKRAFYVVRLVELDDGRRYLYFKNGTPKNVMTPFEKEALSLENYPDVEDVVKSVNWKQSLRTRLERLAVIDIENYYDSESTFKIVTLSNGLKGYFFMDGRSNNPLYDLENF